MGDGMVSAEGPRASRRRGRGAACVAAKVSPSDLERAALTYLSRYATSVANLRQVLWRRVKRSAQAHDTDCDEAKAWIDALIERLTGLGYLDDRGFAQAQVRRLRRRGSSLASIRAKLMTKGIGAPLIEELLRDQDQDAELGSAWAYARRRRLGPYRAQEAQREARRDKDLAAMARAGFGRDVAERVIDDTSRSDSDAQ